MLPAPPLPRPCSSPHPPLLLLYPSSPLARPGLAPPLPRPYSSPAPPLPLPKEKKLLLLKPQCTPQECEGGGSKEREERREGEGEMSEGESMFSAGDLQWMSEREIARTSHHLQLGYSNWNVGAVLCAVLPTCVKEVPSAFETVGHIAHLNLREEHLEYKNLIGGLGHVLEYKNLIGGLGHVLEYKNLIGGLGHVLNVSLH